MNGLSRVRPGGAAVLAVGETCGPLRPTSHIGRPRLNVTPDHILYILCDLVGGTPCA